MKKKIEKKIKKKKTKKTIKKNNNQLLLLLSALFTILLKCIISNSVTIKSIIYLLNNCFLKKNQYIYLFTRLFPKFVLELEIVFFAIFRFFTTNAFRVFIHHLVINLISK